MTGRHVFRAFPVVLLLLVSTGHAALAQDLRSVIENTATSATHRDAVTTVPMDVRMGKLFIRAAANGSEREFIFDTGSPSIISRQLADEMGLEIVASNTGRDANGEAITMDIAILETLQIGSVTFEQVPVMVFDFSSLPTGSCLIDGGVIGSEVLPHGVWQLDVPDGEMRIAEDASAFARAADARRLDLAQVGYPFPPVIAYRLGEVNDNALFDTGSDGYVSVFEGVLSNPTVQSEIVDGSLRQGRGSEGESAGGRGPERPISRFLLSQITLGGFVMESVPGLSRAQPPTLIGTGLLERYAVTLDLAGRAMVIEPHQVPVPEEQFGDFELAFSGDGVEVVQLYENTPAAQAGLRLGDRVQAVDGEQIGVSASEVCQTVLWLGESFDPVEVSTLTIVRDGVPVTLDFTPPSAD